MAGELLLDRPADGVLRLTISNPAKRNALDHPILDAIAAVLDDIGDARVVLLTGADGMFSSGYDIGDIPDDVFAQEAERLVAHPFAAALEALETCEVPTVAALPGHTIGGGLELALACDLRVAADGILLGMPPAKLGLVYSHTGLRRFLEAIGAPRTRELFLTARNVDARTALELGTRQPGRRRLRARDRGARPRRRTWPPTPRSACAATSARSASCWRRRAGSTPRSSASSSSCARRASSPRTCARACARSARSAPRAGRAAEAVASNVTGDKRSHKGLGTTASRRLVLLAAAAALLLVPAAAPAHSPSHRPFPKLIALPDGWQPEGIAIKHKAFYVGSIPTGAVYRGDLRSGQGAPLVPAHEGRAATG